MTVQIDSHTLPEQSCSLELLAQAHIMSKGVCIALRVGLRWSTNSTELNV